MKNLAYLLPLLLIVSCKSGYHTQEIRSRHIVQNPVHHKIIHHTPLASTRSNNDELFWWLMINNHSDNTPMRSSYSEPVPTIEKIVQENSEKENISEDKFETTETEEVTTEIPTDSGNEYGQGAEGESANTEESFETSGGTEGNEGSGESFGGESEASGGESESFSSESGGDCGGGD